MTTWQRDKSNGILDSSNKPLHFAAEDYCKQFTLYSISFTIKLLPVPKTTLEDIFNILRLNITKFSCLFSFYRCLKTIRLFVCLLLNRLLIKSRSFHRETRNFLILELYKIHVAVNTCIDSPSPSQSSIILTVTRHNVPKSQTRNNWKPWKLTCIIVAYSYILVSRIWN